MKATVALDHSASALHRQQRRRDAVFGHQAGLQQLAQLAVEAARCSSTDTGWLRTRSLVPAGSKMSVAAMMLRVSLQLPDDGQRVPGWRC